MGAALHPGGGEAPVPDTLLQFVVESSRERVLVFDASQKIVFRSDRARRFLERNALPDEILSLVHRVLAAIASGSAAEQFCGQISFHKAMGGRHWFFRVAHRGGCQPLVVVFFNDETVSSKFDLNVLREQHRLTRRETDVLRHLLDGLNNNETADELVITEQTVKEYLSSIYKKFAVSDRFALLRYLIRATQA